MCQSRQLTTAFCVDFCPLVAASRHHFTLILARGSTIVGETRRLHSDVGVNERKEFIANLY